MIPKSSAKLNPQRRVKYSMYEKILLTLDGTPTDRAIIEHVKQLAKFAHSRLVLLHVADGWAARTYGPDAVSREITEDTAYLHRIQREFQLEGIPADAELAYGDPDHGENHQAATTDSPAVIARTLTTWLASR